jgi:hypothetical protein
VLTSLQSSEIVASAISSLSSQQLSEFSSTLRQLQDSLLHAQRGPSSPTHHRASSPPASESSSIERRNAFGGSATSSSSARRNSYTRMSRSNTFNSSIGDSFLPQSRRASISTVEPRPPSPAQIQSSTDSYGTSPMLKPRILHSHLSDDSGVSSPLNQRRLTRSDSIASRERRDSDSSAAASSTSRVTGSQVSHLPLALKPQLYIHSY